MQIRISKAAVQDMGDEWLVKGVDDNAIVDNFGNATIKLKWHGGKCRHLR